MVEYIGSVRQQLNDEEPDLDMIVVTSRLLCNWIMQHIRRSDGHFAYFLRRSRPTNLPLRKPAQMEATALKR